LKATTAQSAEEVDNAAKEKARTDAQAKGDAAACADGKNCDPDVNCDKWRGNIKRALYGAKPSSGKGDKGLAQRLCEWMHGTLPNGGDHDISVTEGLGGIDKNMKKIKNSKHRCPAPTDLEKEVEEYQNAFKDPASIPHLPRSDFKEFCYKKALELAQKHLGK